MWPTSQSYLSLAELQPNNKLLSCSPHRNNRHKSRIFTPNFCLFTFWVLFYKIRKSFNWGHNIHHKMPIGLFMIKRLKKAYLAKKPYLAKISKSIKINKTFFVKIRESYWLFVCAEQNICTLLCLFILFIIDKKQIIHLDIVMGPLLNIFFGFVIFIMFFFFTFLGFYVCFL